LSRGGERDMSRQERINETLFAVEDLTFAYDSGAKLALEGVSLEVAEGEFVCVTGPSGAGKTTLALALAGVIPHLVQGDLHGTVCYRGELIPEMSMAAIARSIGIVLQDPEAQLFNLTVEEEITFGLQNLKFPREEIPSRVADALEMVGMKDYRQAPSAALSGGQKQRVAIACTLALEPSVLILDEPTSELDPLGSLGVYEILTRLNERGTTIVLVDQELDEVALHVDRIVYLYDGKVRRDCDPKTFFHLVLSGRLGEREVFVPQPAELAYVLSPTDQGLRGRLPLDNDGFVRWWREADAGAGS
jgi:energy-coupling factor transporter ATP-binding protein EcfA2